MGKGETGLNLSISPEMIDSPGSQIQWICTKNNHVAKLNIRVLLGKTDALQQAYLEVYLVIDL